jgi:putative endopeptidase
MKVIKAISIITLSVLISCQPSKEQTAPDMPPALEVSNMDSTVNPRNDFYQFVNGNWLSKTEIPADRGNWGGFSELGKKNNELVLDILETASENPEFVEGSDERKAIDFFSVGMDSLLAEKVGIDPLRSWFEKIDATTKESLQATYADLRMRGYRPFGGVSSGADFNDSKQNTLFISSGGLGLPNRDYYTKTDDKSVEIRTKYLEHIERMFDLAQIEGDNKKKAEAIMNIENRLALASLTPIERRNTTLRNNPMTLDSLQNLAPTISWADLMDQMKVDLSKIDSVIVLEPKHIAEVSAIWNEESTDDIRAYLKWNVINRAANYLNNDMVQANFDFYSTTLRGTEEMRPRWERVLGVTNSVIGEAIGKVYVAETFPPEAKTSAEEMVQNIIKAFDKRIRDLDWMTEETKEMALKKLNKMTVKIGYPDKWRDYSALEVASSGETYSYISNLENAWKWQFEENIKEAGEPVDKSRWYMSPQTVNAYFNPLNNEIVFPAAILQPPFYNYQADAAMNYGGMGAVIGHEISHSFDDSGSRFDADGNLKNWWTDEDREQFEKRTDMLVAQYDAYEALDSVFVQGKLTLGENIGDLGGLNAAHDGLQMHLESNGNPGLIDGFTPEQRFFISWATIWRTKYRDETLRTRVMTDPHSPGMFRAIGPLENMDQFYAAFDIREGDELWKPEDQRVRIW